MASLFGLSVPNRRAKENKTAQSVGSRPVTCGVFPSWETTHWPQIKASCSFLEVVQKYSTLFSISGFIHDYCSLEYP